MMESVCNACVFAREKGRREFLCESRWRRFFGASFNLPFSEVLTSKGEENNLGTGCSVYMFSL